MLWLLVVIRNKQVDIIVYNVISEARGAILVRVNARLEGRANEYCKTALVAGL